MSPIYKITGSLESCKHTMASMFLQDDELGPNNVLTAEDEGCSWIFLLDALQTQERVSREWDRGKDNKAWDHTICCLVQRKRKCWDFMPLIVTKPYATTTICHLIEMVSMLGLVWNKFDVMGSRLTAKGNGYLIKSEGVRGLGILARISRFGKPSFEGNRIIPCQELKRLCFGEVPSLFDADKKQLQVGPGRLKKSLAVLLPGLSREHRQAFLPCVKSTDKNRDGEEGEDDEYVEDAEDGEEEEDWDEDLPIITRELSYWTSLKFCR